MAASNDATAKSAESQPHQRERKSTWKGVLLVLGVLMAVSWLANLSDRLAPHPVIQSPSAAMVEATGSAATFASAFRDYQSVEKECEAADFGSQRGSVSFQDAMDACGNSVRAVMDLPALYGEPAAPLQNCIDMEGARISALGMAQAIQEGRGDPMQDQMNEVQYVRSFKMTRARCAAAMAQIQRNIGAGQ